MMAQYHFDKQSSKRIAEVTRRVEKTPQNENGRRPRPNLSHILEGVLDDDLSEASAIDDPSTATMTVYGGKGDNFHETDHEVTVTNRSLTFTADAGDLIQVIRVNGEWRPANAGADTKENVWGFLDEDLTEGGTAEMTCWKYYEIGGWQIEQVYDEVSDDFINRTVTVESRLGQIGLQGMGIHAVGVYPSNANPAGVFYPSGIWC